MNQEDREPQSSGDQREARGPLEYCVQWEDYDESWDHWFHKDLLMV
jgi:hypothetical protein